MDFQTLPAEKVYHLPRYVNVYLLVFPFLGLAFIGFALLTFLPPLNESFENSLEGTIIGIVFFIAMMGIYLAIKQTRLVLTEEGIIYYGWGFRIYTPWQNVLEIGYIQPYSPFPLTFRKVWGLRLRQPSVLGMKLADGKRQSKAALEADWWNPASAMVSFATILPMSPIFHNRNWKESPLGKDIQQYAPWTVAEQYPQETEQNNFS